MFDEVINNDIEESKTSVNKIVGRREKGERKLRNNCNYICINQTKLLDTTTKLL